MRVAPPQLYSGRFWLPATPDRSQPGTLRIDDGGKVTLELVGRLDKGHPYNAPDEYQRVVGEVVQHGFVTLENCVVTVSGSYGTGAPYKHQLEPHLTIIGHAYGETAPMLYSDVRFSIEGLDEWLAITGLKVSWLTSADKTLSVEFTPPEKRELWKDDKFSIRCEFDYSAPTTPLKSAEINQTAFLRLRSATPAPLEEFVSKIHILVHLVSLAVDETVSVQTVTASAETIRQYVGTKSERPKSLPVYFESLSFSTKPPTIREIGRLFKLDDLPVSSQAALDAWLRFHANSPVAANLFFSTRKQRFEYINIQFILMAQAAEVYHRNSSKEQLMPNADYKKLKKQILEAVPPEHRPMIGAKLAHGNDLTLANRLERLMAPFEHFFGDAATRALTIKSIVGIRNDYTHWSNAEGREDGDGLDPWRNLMRLDMLMQMQLLKELGYSVGDVVRILEDNPVFQRHQPLLKPANIVEPKSPGTPKLE